MSNIRYSTNWMGVASLDWYRNRGLIEKKTIALTEDSLMVKCGNHKAGDILEVDEPTEYYSCGRLDFWNPFKDSIYPDEIAVPPMRNEDWNSFSKWLDKFRSETVLTLDEIVQEYENTNSKIRWWKDI